jgi:cell division cycle protein 37
MESSDEHLLQLNANLLKYSQTSDYGLLVKILKADPSLLNEKNEETLLLRALCFEVCSRSKEARNCVMVSLILKFVRNLGVSGIDLFFSK